ncbi:hypothetical protein A8C56_21235 [Niabella ginsenosidivorans]|uniref:Type I restriction modification DNA specificity domain-containing protein n=1 Tax=Niabella ginsenosidivorans TaxID=1176587 RepID=A0A1A9I671_9BACT|nr:restriction endonuclease subunit S [Niabella ginsenosidivorans]ANH83168.1 hypothetical protein A8C56_21235 [Niabella ginsenosidivorans]
MEIGKGYKATEIGIIPNDWNIKEIGSIAIIKTGAKNTQDKIDNGVYPFFVRSQIVERINSYSFDGEAVLTAGDGVGTGKVFHYINGKFDYHQRVYCIRGFDNTVNGYYFFIYFSNNFYSRIMQMTAKSSVDSVRMEMIAKMKIPLPSLEEQSAIAISLRNADSLIRSLEKLITKKRNVRQGILHQLMQPKKEWEVKNLSEIAIVRDGTHQTPKYVESGIPFYSVENVTNNDFTNTKFISPVEHALLTRSFRIEKGDILMTRIGSIGDFKLIDWDVNASFYVSLALLKVKRGVSASFLCHYSKTDEFKKEIEWNSLQFAIPKKINLGQISMIKVQLPPLGEQIRITNILTDIDTEIAALDAKLEKYRQIKQGIMQQLLTGKIRLI